LTAAPQCRQNAHVHRLILAIGVSALVWAAAARTTPVPSDAITAMASACAVDGDSHGPNDSGQLWRNAHHAIAVVTESVWKSAPVHAGLGATRVARIFEIARLVSSPGPPSAATPLYLRHTPLLI
jgi:hypothetical protein